MLAKGLNHVSFAVRDLEASRAFYEGILGLEPVPRPDIGLPGVWLRAGSTEVHLIALPEAVDAGRPPAKLSPLANHTAFAIEDYDATVALFRERGAEVFETSRDNGQLWVHDPDGNVIEFISGR
jgi:catechol 2,3-dioxygenase-like lactoylglutathione lyase family enzyme